MPYFNTEGECREGKHYMLPAAARLSEAGSRIADCVQAWALRCPLPLVLLFDEIDSLAGESLNSVLRQLRDGFSWRPHAFPASVAVCGMRHLRDYKIAAGSGEPVRSGRGSPFNNAATYRLANFTVPEVAALYAQHTAETGQDFTTDAIDLVYDSTQGQPWLVNAIAAEITEEMRLPLSETITAVHVESATERLIEARAVHLDSLAARLAEPRVQKVIGPIIASPEFGPAGFKAEQP